MHSLTYDRIYMNRVWLQCYETYNDRHLLKRGANHTRKYRTLSWKILNNFQKSQKSRGIFKISKFSRNLRNPKKIEQILKNLTKSEKCPLKKWYKFSKRVSWKLFEEVKNSLESLRSCRVTKISKNLKKAKIIFEKSESCLKS